jgi:mannose-6-phosphate isomerase
MSRMYPMEITPRLVEAIWGGEALVARYGKPGDLNAKLGESWECWTENPIAAGVAAGKRLGEVMRVMGPALTGLTPLPDRHTFPVLTKIIDAHLSLSVQVHPTDLYARTHEGQPNGKTECWMILEAAAGAELILGFTKKTDAAEYRRRVADGSLGDILRRVPVKKGDVFHIPAGTLHSIGAGVVLFETQQSSDLTYRIFDWNRVAADGKARELQIEKAADVLDFRESECKAVQPLAYRLFGAERSLLVADTRFGVEEITLTARSRYLIESVATLFMAEDQEIEMRAGDENLTLRPWRTYLLPAGIDRAELWSRDSGAKLLVVTPPGADERARRRLELAGVDPARVQSFLAQFAER